MKNKLVLILGMFINSVFSIEPVSQLQELFISGNKLYESGEYKSAIQHYELLLNKGVREPILYYNLGNAYYRTKLIGNAIWCYELSHRLSPRDEDIKYNLKFLRTIVKEPEESIGEKIINIFNFNEITILTTTIYFLFIIGIITSLFFRWEKIKLINTVMGCIFLLTVTFWYLKYIYQEKTVYGIIISSQVEARTGPGEDYSVGFTLPEGKKVKILSEKDEWYSIATKQLDPEVIMLKGWIKKEVVKKLSLP